MHLASEFCEPDGYRRFKRRTACPHAKTTPPLLSSGLCHQVTAHSGAPQSKTVSTQYRGTRHHTLFWARDLYTPSISPGLKYSSQLWMRRLHSSRPNIPFPMRGSSFLLLRHAEISISCAKYSGPFLLYQKTPCVIPLHPDLPNPPNPSERCSRCRALSHNLYRSSTHLAHPSGNHG